MGSRSLKLKAKLIKKLETELDHARLKRTGDDTAGVGREIGGDGLIARDGARDRRGQVRVANSAEFDAPLHPAMSVAIPSGRQVPPISKALQAVYSHIPPLCALVARLHPKRHVVTAVYRGSAFFPTVEHQGRTIGLNDDDCNVSVILEAITFRRGIDGEEWKAFVERYTKAFTALTPVSMQRESTNV